MCVVMLPDSRMGEVNLAIIQKYRVERSYIHPSMSYWRAMPPALSFLLGRKEGVLERSPQNATNAPSSVKKYSNLGKVVEFR